MYLIPNEYNAVGAIKVILAGIIVFNFHLGLPNPSIFMSYAFCYKGMKFQSQIYKPFSVV